MVSRVQDKCRQMDGSNVASSVRPTPVPVFVRSASRTSSTRSNGLLSRLNVSPVMAIRRRFHQRNSQLSKETPRETSADNGCIIPSFPSFPSFMPFDRSISLNSTTSSEINELNVEKFNGKVS
jgi:hypothetical protein